MNKLAVLTGFLLAGCAAGGESGPTAVVLKDGSQGVLIQCGNGVVVNPDSGRSIVAAGKACPKGYDIESGKPENYTMVVRCK